MGWAPPPCERLLLNLATKMATFIKEAIDYLAGQAANVSKETDTADGNTDDKSGTSQYSLIKAGSTDARTIANDTFKPEIRIPALVIAGEDVYDVTQSYTRINKLYDMTRANFYEQSKNAGDIRKKRLEHKQKLIASCVRQSEEPKKSVENTLNA